MRLATTLVQELAPAVLRDMPVDEQLTGRLVLTRRLVEGLVGAPGVAEVVAFGAEPGIVPGVDGRPFDCLGGWLSDDVVWIEPARHYWWQASLIRQAVGRPFPIVTVAHSVGYGHQVLPLIASLAAPRLPGDVVIAPSALTARALLDQCQGLIEALGIRATPPEVVVVPYGVPPVRRIARGAARAALGWDEATPIALFVGRLRTTDKADFGALFEAAAALASEGLAFRLVVAGAGRAEEAARVRALADRAAPAGRIEVRANVSEAEKHLLYGAADLFVSPSNATSESFGLSLLEAMGHALPVVCTAWSGYREIVRDGVEGRLVDTWWDEASAARAELGFALGQVEGLSGSVTIEVADLTRGLRELLLDGRRRRAMGAAGRQRAAALTLDRTVEGVLEVCARARARCPASLGRAAAGPGAAAALGVYATRRWRGAAAEAIARAAAGAVARTAASAIDREAADPIGQAAGDAIEGADGDGVAVGPARSPLG